MREQFFKDRVKDRVSVKPIHIGFNTVTPTNGQFNTVLTRLTQTR